MIRRSSNCNCCSQVTAITFITRQIKREPTIYWCENLRGDYQRRFIPPLTRANPDPPQESLAQAREIQNAQQALSDLETAIRGMAVPAQDRIWWRFRQEEPLLRQLLQFDLALVHNSEQVYRYVAQLTPDNWSNQVITSLRQMTQQLTQIARDRERYLLLPM